MAGKRLSIWIPEKDCWIFDVLESLQRQFEERGFPVSHGELLREYLLPALEPYKGSVRPSAPDPDSIRTDKPKSLKRSVVFRQNDVWFYDALVRIVETKQSTGFRTSLSYELIRLAKNSLTGSVNGSAFDRKVLEV